MIIEKSNQAESTSVLELLYSILDRLGVVENCIKEHTPKDLLTSKEAAKYLNVKMNWLDKLCHDGKISYTRPGGKVRFFKKSDLDSYLKRNLKKSESDLEREADNFFFGKQH